MSQHLNVLAQKHAIPVSAIPCLHYRNAKEREDEKVREREAAAAAAAAAAAEGKPAIELPCARIESVQENAATHSINGAQLREYCSKLFTFKTIRVMRYKYFISLSIVARVSYYSQISGAGLTDASTTRYANNVKSWA